MTSHYSYDMPQNYHFGGGSDSSVVTPLALVGLILSIFLIFSLPRRRVIVPLLAACLLIPFGINIVAFGLHFPTLRLLLLAAWVRFVARREVAIPRLNSIDKAFLVWALSTAVAFSLLWGSMGAVTNRIAFLWDALGSYFLARMLLRDKQDLLLFIKTIAILLAVIAPAMAMEHITGRNLFSILGAPELSDMRYGAIRAKGPFGHAIIAGTIGAMLMPLFVGSWRQGNRDRILIGFGILCSVLIAVSAASSTPLMTYAAGILGLLLWRMRQHTRILRWGLALSILSLHLVMKAPVWMLIARTGGAIGGSGEHRALLIDNFIRHFGQWFLLGTRDNPDWGYDMWDVDNAFVAAGIGGGFIAFIAFIALFVYAYRQIGKSRRLVGLSRNDQRLIWAIGASLFANNVGFFGIVYFDQTVLLWYLLLAMVSVTSLFPISAADAPKELYTASAEAQTALVACG